MRVCDGLVWVRGVVRGFMVEGVVLCRVVVVVGSGVG